MHMNARYFSIEDGYIQCELCPNRCKIREGKTGICNVRLNDGETLALPFYGRLSALGIDPIEKKPLYHFYPGSPILSAGFVGCSLQCPFCQNHSISQSAGRADRYVGPEELVEIAKDQNSFGIAYTYSEPTVHTEYVLEASEIARRKGLKNVLVSNGYLNPEPADDLLELTDAANIDLKCFNDDFYRKEIKGRLEPVLEFIRKASEKTRLEVTTLIIPGKNDSDEEMEQIASFLAGLDPEIPLHLSCYYPSYKYTIPRTQYSMAEHLAAIARKKLPFVYLGNVGLRETNTYCPSCGELLIRRSGYTIRIPGLQDGACANCGRKIQISTLSSASK